MFHIAVPNIVSNYVIMHQLSLPHALLQQNPLTVPYVVFKKCTMFIQTEMNGELTLQVESLNYKSEMVANCV